MYYSIPNEANLKFNLVSTPVTLPLCLLMLSNIWVWIDSKLTWKNHIHFVVEKLCIAKGVICKLRHYIPNTVLRSVYFGIVYSHLQYGITSWGKAAAKYTDRIRVQQKYIVKIMTSSSFLRVKLSPIYQQLIFLNLNSIYHLEVLKFVYKFRSKTLPRAFHNYFSLSSETLLRNIREISKKYLDKI